jgi:hypothetical protein
MYSNFDLLVNRIIKFFWSENFISNFLAEIIGVALSLYLGYRVINGYLKKKEEERWSGVDNRIYKRILHFISDFFFAINLMTVYKRKFNSNEVDLISDMPPMTIEAYKKLLDEDIHLWKVQHWHVYQKSLKNTKERTSRILDIHQVHLSRLSSEITEKLIEIEDSCGHLLFQIGVTIGKDGELLEGRKNMKVLFKSLKKPMVSFYKLIFDLRSIIETQKKIHK